MIKSWIYSLLFYKKKKLTLAVYLFIILIFYLQCIGFKIFWKKKRFKKRIYEKRNPLYIDWFFIYKKKKKLTLVLFTSFPRYTVGKWKPTCCRHSIIQFLSAHRIHYLWASFSLSLFYFIFTFLIKHFNFQNTAIRVLFFSAASFCWILITIMIIIF